MVKRKNGKEIAPCIVSKVRHALEIKTEKPQNAKTCSRDYWNETVEVVGNGKGLDKQIIQAAKNAYNRYM